jgi:hypothetical protein
MNGIGRCRIRVAGALSATVVSMALVAVADEASIVDLPDLNQRIGMDYEEVLTSEDLVREIAGASLLLYGETHDQKTAAHQFVRLAVAMSQSRGQVVRIGIEFVDRGDSDILEAYLKGVLREDEFLDRVMPNSLLLAPGLGDAHMTVLREARRLGLTVVPLESRPSGSRPSALRNAEIRWNLFQELARHPDDLFAVLYGVDHVLGIDPIQRGLPVASVIVTSYGDSAQVAFRRREGRDPRRGEVLRLREQVYLQAVGGPPSERRLLGMDFEGNEELLESIESVYSGSRDNLVDIVDALMHPHVRWRRAALHALLFVAADPQGYDPEAPQESRRQAQRRWKEWLERRAAAVAPDPERRGGDR